MTRTEGYIPGSVGEASWDNRQIEGVPTAVGRVVRGSLVEAVRFGIAAFIVENGLRLAAHALHPGLLLPLSFRWAAKLGWLGLFYGAFVSGLREGSRP